MSGDRVYLLNALGEGRYEAISKLETKPYLDLPKDSDHAGFEHGVTHILVSYSLYCCRSYVPELGIWTFPYVYFGTERMEMGDTLRLYTDLESDELTVLDVQYICTSDSEPDVVSFRGTTYKRGADLTRATPKSLPELLRNTGDTWYLGHEDVTITHERIAGRFYSNQLPPRYGKQKQGFTKCETRCEALKSLINSDVLQEIRERVKTEMTWKRPWDGSFYRKFFTMR